MSHVAVATLDFHVSRHTVYEALCNLEHHPDWNIGMISISEAGPMHAGLRYTTHSKVLGGVIQADVLVEQAVPDEFIELACYGGPIKFRTTFEITEVSPAACTVTCRINFDKTVFKLANPIVEAATESHIRGNLEKLRDTLGA